ncbi:PAS domain-containing protein [Pedobacter sp.]|uniref:PAS domain-containing protein n=1 Tax=Pedobacter sp. TaxID=1411316 RepID=UPI003D7F4FCF
MEIFNVFPTPGFIIQPTLTDYIIIAINGAFLLSEKLDRDEFIGRSFTTLFSNLPDFPIVEWTGVFRKVESEKTTAKFAFQSPDQRNLVDVITKEITCTPVFGDEKAVQYILCTVTAVTGLAMDASGNQSIEDGIAVYKDQLEMGCIGAWDLDLVSNKVVWNSVQREIHEVDAFYQPTLTSIISFYKINKEKSMIAELVEDARNNGGRYDVEVSMISAKGNEKLVRAAGQVTYKDNRAIRIHGVTQIIKSYQKHTAVELSSSPLSISLMESAGIVVWEIDAQSTNLLYLSENVVALLGYSVAQWRDDSSFWKQRIHPADLDFVDKNYDLRLKKRKDFSIWFRIQTARGLYKRLKCIVSFVDEAGLPLKLRGLLIDTTEPNGVNEIGMLEKRILKLNGQEDVSIQDVLLAYLDEVEAIYPKMKCAIFQVKDSKLYKWAAPSLPTAYLIAIDGLPVNKSVGCSGAVAFLKQNIFIPDVETDPRCAKYRRQLVKAGIKASWSYPIMNANNEVLATLGVYFDEARLPNSEELLFLKRTTRFLKLIIENRMNIEMLKENNMLMQQCQDMAHFGIWSWNVVSNTLTWSDPLYKIFGLDQATYKTTFEDYLNLLHPDNREAISVVFGGVLSTKKEARFEEKIVRPNGEIRFLKSFAKVVMNEAGVVLKLIGASMDITESKNMQEELLKSESHFRNLAESQTNYVTRINFEGRFTYCNDQCIADFGWLYDNQVLLGRSVYKLLMPIQYQRFYDLAENCISEPNKVYNVEIEMPTPDGKFKVVLWHVVCLTDSNGLPLEMQSIGIDVTEQKLANEALSINNERYKYVTMASNDAIYDWDISKDDIHWGAGYRRLFKNKFPLNKWVSDIHPEDRMRVENSLRAVLADQEKHIWSINYQWKKGEGNYSIVEENSYILRDITGTAIRMIGGMREITNRTDN